MQKKERKENRIPHINHFLVSFFVGKFSKESLYMHSPQPKFSCGYTINNVSSACYLQENTMPSLRKALKDVAMEKDVAVVAREDLSAQLRTLKKRMKEAEEEQYRAEEDAAALRAELNSLQHAMHNLPCSIATIGYSVDQIQAMEKELSNLTSKLEKESLMRQQEHQLLTEEQAHTSALIIQKQELEEKLASTSKKASDRAKEQGNNHAFTLYDIVLVDETKDGVGKKLKLGEIRYKLVVLG
ncbi:hypothetical protein OROGR_029862 [Orobanche gracilis]